MEPINIKSELSLKNYYKINLAVMWTRMRWILAALLIFIIYTLSTTDYASGDSSIFIEAGLFVGAIIFWIPLINYFAVRRMYKKVKSMSEPKVYEIDDANIKLTGQTLSATMDWQVIDKVKEKENYFLAFVSNSRGIHFLPKKGFDKPENIAVFKNLVKSKQVKNNFKDVKSFSPLPVTTS